MKYTTSLSHMSNGKESIRGYDLADLMKKKTFVETIFLLLKGELPNAAEAAMLDALFTAAIDHGPGTASSQTARIVASAKNSMHTSVAAGILAMGQRHGSAIEGAAKFFQENKDTEDVLALAKTLKEQKIRVAGYGHAVLSHDERSESLFSIAKEQGVYGKHCEFAENFHKALNEISSKTLPINIDGSMGAILSDMGFNPDMMKGFFMIARVPGLVAQVYEEQTSGGRLRRLPEEDIEYTGVEDRDIV